MSASPTAVTNAAPSSSAPPLTSAAGEKSREVRLGIVMYGGISLAIYIYGVAYELFRAVRGRGVYKLLKAITDSDVVVDIASGTSAGGINGILLSYALCNERDLGAAAALWREDGDLDRMLRPPDTPDAACQSVLDSEGYYQDRLQRAFANMPALSPEPGEDPTAVGELDLFVTSTDVDGSVTTRFDDAGRPVDVKDHRAVFILKHRPGRLEPFAPDAGATGDRPGPRIAALSKLARMTSCFPVAFAPVLVRHAGADASDQLLCTWGALQRDTCFLDGGLLDNKPFTHTMGAIFNRLADREVARVLFYVEPDPERFAQPETPTRPNVVEAALDALVTIPGYESIADDLRLLSRHNNQVEQYARLVADLGSQPPEPSRETANLHRRSRLIALTNRAVDGILKRAGRDTLMTEEQKQAATRLIKAFDDEVRGPLARALVDGGGPDDRAQAVAASRVDALLDDFDVYFRQRRLFRVTYLIYDLLSAERVSRDLAPRYRDILRAMNRQLKVYEILQWAMEGLIDRGVFRLDDAPAAWEQVQAALRQLLDDRSAVAALIPDHFVGAEPWLPQDHLTRVRDALLDLSGVIEAAISAGQLAPGEPGHSLLLRTDGLEAEMLAPLSPDDPVRAAYASFLALDAVLYPLELMSGLHEKDAIRIVRISPLDATTGFSNRSLPDKVAGDAAYHFGGFLKRSWRSNDILWGRLDGACKLVEALLAPESSRSLGGRLRRVAEHGALRPAILLRLQGEPALDPAALFPRSGARVQDELRAWLLAAFDPDSAKRAAALEDGVVTQRTALLVEAAQLEILGEDVPKVIVDAIGEQAAWNAYKVSPRGSAPSWDAKGWTFQPSGRETDPQVTLTAAAKIAADEMRKLEPPSGPPPTAPSQTPLGRFFTESYRVGAESMDHIPPLVLLQIALGALMVLRRCLVNALGERARGGVADRAMRIAGAFLTIAHALTVLSRRAPTWGIASALAVAAICATFVVIGLWWANPLLHTAAGWLTFLVVPVVVLAVEVLLLRWISRRYARVGG